MRTSAEIGEWAKAMAECQARLQNPAKDKVNPHYRSRYTDLSTVLETIRTAAAPLGLSLIQGPQDTVLVSRVLHSSGQWLEIDHPLLAPKPDAQGMGSAVTYARRYSALALFALAGDDDDDGQATSAQLSGSARAKPAKPAASTRSAAHPRTSSQPPDTVPTATAAPGPPKTARDAALRALERAGYDTEEKRRARVIELVLLLTGSDLPEEARGPSDEEWRVVANHLEEVPA